MGTSHGTRHRPAPPLRLTRRGFRALMTITVLAGVGLGTTIGQIVIPG